jgi:hypothetical protein
MTITDINYEPIINRAKNMLLAAFIFGSIGAWVGIQTMNTIDARQDDRINAVLKANTATSQPAVQPPIANRSK